MMYYPSDHASDDWDLGPLGRQWTLKSLRDGKTVSNNILARIRVDDGSTKAVGVARRKQLSHLRDLEEAILPDAPRPSGSVESAIHAAIRQLAWEASSVIILVEDDLRQPDDPVVRRASPGSTIITDNTVCHIRTLKELSQPAETDAFLSWSASGYPLNCFVFQSIPRDHFSRLLISQQYDELISHLVLIVNTVFDSDAFAVWTPVKTKP